MNNDIVVSEAYNPEVFLPKSISNNRSRVVDQDNEPEQKNITLPDTVSVQIPLEFVRNLNLHDMQNNSDQQKKRVGRPSKKPPPFVPTTRGILQEPSTSEDNRVEFIFQSSYIFKQLAAIYRHMNAHEIEFRFDPDSLKTCVVDRDKASVTFMDINVENAISYYCKEPTVIGVRRKRLEEVFVSNNKKSTPPAIFEIKQDTYRSILYITLTETEYDTTDTLPVELIQPPELDPSLSEEPDWRSYPLIITLPSSMLKEFVNCTRDQTVTLNFEKTGDDNISMSLYSEHKLLRKKEFKNEGKIKLESKLTDDIISVAIGVYNAKPMISSRLTENITIAIDAKRPLMFMYESNIFTFKQFINLTNLQSSSF
jgi:hypothetical protein